MDEIKRLYERGIPVRATEADAEFHSRLIQALAEAERRNDAKRVQELNRQTIRWQTQKIGSGKTAELFECFSWYRLAEFELGSGLARDGLNSLGSARRACQRLGSKQPKTLSIAMDRLQGNILLFLSRRQEALTFLDRAFQALKADRFADIGQVPEVTGDYADALSDDGKADAGRDRLIEAWKSVAARQWFESAKIDLMVSLSANASARGFQREAAEWAENADLLMTATAAFTQVAYFTKVKLRRAETTWTLYGAEAAVPFYREIVEYRKKNEPGSIALALSLMDESYVELAAGRKEAAASRFAEAEAVLSRITATPRQRWATLNYAHQYYSWTSNCARWPRAAADRLTAAAGAKIAPNGLVKYQRDYAVALASCGRGGDALKLLERAQSALSAMPAYEALRHRFYIALAHYLSGNSVEAVRVQTPLCSQYRNDAASTQRTANPKLGSAEWLTNSAATCYQTLLGYHWFAEKKSPSVSASPQTMGDRGRDMFEIAQWSQQATTDDGVSLSLALAAADRAGPDAGARAREFEESSRKVTELRRTIEEGLDRRDLAQAGARDAELIALEASRDAARSRLTAAFSGYWEERTPSPVSLDALTADGTGALLNKDEAVLLVVPGAWETAPATVFAVSRERSAMAAIDMPVSRLSELIDELREQIQPSATDVNRGAGAGIQPFNRKAAADLYEAIFGSADIRAVTDPAKTLIYVPSGPFRQIPLGVLVSRLTGDPVASNAQALAETQWLIKDKAVTTFPSLSALQRLRSRQAPARGGAPRMLAFADADFGSANQSGPAPASAAERAMRGASRAVEAIARGYPLLDDLAPAGTNEMTRIAAALGLSREGILTGRQATEAEFKRLNASGTLASYSLIGFATHGLLASESGVGEPALALSNPAVVSGAEDGLLAASEIARLELGADLVILSACNSGSDPTGQSALALARAFLQAKARSLLVTQWYVGNEVGPALLPVMFDWRRTHPEDSSAEALRQAQLSLMRNAKIAGAHPAQWAAYSLVGDARLN